MNADKLHDLAALRACGRGHSWQDIAQHLGCTWQAARSQWRRKARKLDPGVCPVCGDEPRATWEEQGNHAHGSTVTDGPISLPEFLALLRVDTDAWKVADWGAKRWQVGAKIELGDLVFDAGRISGHLSKRGLGVQDLWSTWAKFIRRQPIALAPVVQPVACPVSYTVPLVAPAIEVQTALLISDLHVGYERDNRTAKLRPFHDRRAIDAVFQVCRAGPFSYIVIAGDLLDLTNCNDKYSRSPSYYWTTQPAILETHWILRTLRELQPEAPIAILAGNHENRIKRSLEKHLIEAYDLRAADEMELPPALSPAKLLAVHQLGIEWINEYPAGELWLGPLRVSHGEVAHKPPGASARAVLDDSTCDNAFGHTHRLEMVSRRVRVPGGVEVFKSMSIACLCHTDGRVPPSGSPEHWQQGFAVVNYSEWDWSPTLVSLDRGRAVVGGLELRGEDYTDRLREDLPDWNW